MRYAQQIGGGMTFGPITPRILSGILLLLVVNAASAWEPLEAVDTSSPRATMESFLRLTEEASRRSSEYRDFPAPETQDRLFQIADHAKGLFDLRQVGLALQREVAADTFYLIWEVMARTGMPDLEQAPGPPGHIAGGEQKEPPVRWRVPRTEISIVRVDEGPQAGEFLFSSDTVKRAQRFYEAVSELPDRNQISVPKAYRRSLTLVGWLIPLSWVEALPNWAVAPILGQVLWKWFALFLLFGLTLSLVVAIFRLTRRHRRENAGILSLLRFGPPLAMFIFNRLLLYLGTYQLNVTGSGAKLLDYAVELVSGAAVVWIVWLIATLVAERIIATPHVQAESLDANLIRLAGRSVGFLAAVVLLFRIGDEVGIPVYGLVAGAGVSGIAIALATRSTFENFIGALNLFADRPVGVGDLCRYDEDQSGDWKPMGRVESIGLRSIKIRKMDRSLITVPNADFAQRHVTNLSTCDRFLLAATLGLRYETTDDQLRYVLGELRELLHAHPKTIHSMEEPLRARFVGFGAYSLDIGIRAYIRTSNFNEFLAIQEDILLRIMKIVESSGTGFAFPSRTLYHARDSGLDVERGEEAEKQVREWASAHNLPFPDLPDDYREAITDTLDYPPEGSPGADRG